MCSGQGAPQPGQEGKIPLTLYSKEDGMRPVTTCPFLHCLFSKMHSRSHKQSQKAQKKSPKVLPEQRKLPSMSPLLNMLIAEVLVGSALARGRSNLKLKELLMEATTAAPSPAAKSCWTQMQHTYANSICPNEHTIQNTWPGSYGYKHQGRAKEKQRVFSGGMGRQVGGHLPFKCCQRRTRFSSLLLRGLPAA